MTRRKRTPSASASASASVSQKRVAFETPASLQQFSTMSPSLAAGVVDARTHAPTPSNQTGSSVHSHSMPAAQSSSHAGSSPSPSARAARNVPAKFIPQKRSFPDAQPWPQPVPSPNAYSAVSRNVNDAIQQSRSSAPAPMPFAAQPSGAPTMTSPPPRSASNPTAPSESATADEPSLEPGETPILGTHSSWIAAMIAKKRVEAEAKGALGRWARRQAEYKLAKSPAAQLANELSHEANRNRRMESQPRSTSNPLPARTGPQGTPATGANPRVRRVQTPAADTAGTPATEASKGGTQTGTATPSNEDDSLFGSPFSSPIAEFLEQATDHAGLPGSTEPNNTAPGDESDAATPASHRPGISQPADARKSTGNGEIPPLFSERRMPAQPQPLPFHPNSSNNANASQPSQTASQPQQSPSNPSGSAQTQTPSTGPATMGARPQGPPFMTPPTPFYPPNYGVPGYYKFDPRQWSNSPTGNFANSSPVSTPAGYGSPPVYMTPPGSMPYPAYPMGAPSYVAGAPPPTPAGVTRGAAPPPAQPPMRLSASGFMTAADIVASASAGANRVDNKFRIATQNGFSVPKRY